MEILINTTGLGTYVMLELYDNQSFTLNYKNPIFSFGNIEISRTSTFSIPKTSRNIHIFNSCDTPILYGSQMRIFTDCIANFDGKIYQNSRFIIQSASDSEYSCVLFYGELLVLKKLKELGNCADLWIRHNEEMYVGEQEFKDVDNYKNANNQSFRTDLWDIYKYATNAPVGQGYYRMPSTNLHEIAMILGDNAVIEGGINISNPNTSANEYMLKGIAGESGIYTQNFTQTENYASSQLFTGGAVSNIIFETTAPITAGADNRINDNQGIVHTNCWRVTQDCTITFPYMSTINVGGIPTRYVLLVWGYGGSDPSIPSYVAKYNLDENTNGTIVEFSSDENNTEELPYRFLIMAQFVNLNQDGVNYYYFRNGNQYGYRIVPNIDVNLHIEFTNDGIFYPIRLTDTLRRFDMMQLYQLYANVVRGVLNVNESGGLELFYGVFDEPKELSNITQFRSIKRSVDFLAKKTVAKYADDEDAYVLNAENELISEETTLYELPVINGEKRYEDVVVFDDIITEFDEESLTQVTSQNNDNIGIMRISTDDVTMSKYVELTPPTFIEMINIHSTTIEVDVAMSEYDFITLKNTQCYTYEGAHWALESSSWSGGIAKLKLIRIRWEI